MTTQPTPPPRTRHRLYQLPTFDNFIQGRVARRGWIDRLKFGIPGLGLNSPIPLEAFIPYLRQRSAERNGFFRVATPNQRTVHIVFPGAHWLFKLKLQMWIADGAWRGTGSLEANATRLFAAIADHHDTDDVRLPTVNGIDLMRLQRRSAIRALTLDGKDNLIPDYLVPRAMQLDWAAFVQSYLSAVVEAVSETIGSRTDAGTNRIMPEPLIRLPAPRDWTVKEVEIYSECRADNALLRVHDMAQGARSIADVFTLRENSFDAARSTEEAPTSSRDSEAPSFSEGRAFNMPSLRIGLGAKGVHLSVYAKTVDRVRLEVCYRQYPMRVARLSDGELRSSHDYISRALLGISADARRRSARFLRAYLARGESQTSSLVPFVLAINSATAACRSNSRLIEVLSFLIIHGGCSHSRDPELQQIIENLVQAGVLQQIRASLGGAAAYTLSPNIAGIFQALRDSSRRQN